MSWQDELRRLDEELSAGRLPAEDYRRRRNLLLAQAGPSPTPAPPDSQNAPARPSGPDSQDHPDREDEPDSDEPDPQPVTAATPSARTGPPETGAPEAGPPEAGSVEMGSVETGSVETGPAVTDVVNPFPPAFSWHTEQPSETIRVIGSTGPDPDDADDTQIVPRPETEPDTDRTQVVEGEVTTRVAAPGAQPSGGQPSGGQPSGAQPSGGQPSGARSAGWLELPVEDDGSSPPWGASEFPPLVDANDAGWFKQGPEVFDAQRSRGSVKTAIGAGGVLVLIGLVVGAIVVFKPKPPVPPPAPAATGAPSSSAAAVTTAEAPTGPPIAALPGVTVPNTVQDFAAVRQINYLTPEELSIYSAGLPTQARFADAHDGPTRVIVLIVAEQSPGAAVKAARDLNNQQLAFGFKQRPGAPGGTHPVANDTAPGGPLRRVHFASGPLVVRIQVQGSDGAAVDDDFATVLAAQLAQTPVNG